MINNSVYSKFCLFSFVIWCFLCPAPHDFLTEVIHDMWAWGFRVFHEFLAFYFLIWTICSIFFGKKIMDFHVFHAWYELISTYCRQKNPSPQPHSILCYISRTILSRIKKAIIPLSSSLFRSHIEYCFQFCASHFKDK